MPISGRVFPVENCWPSVKVPASRFTNSSGLSIACKVTKSRMQIMQRSTMCANDITIALSGKEIVLYVTKREKMDLSSVTQKKSL
jgi:hypothetical protein